jgi:hypothetical protein
MGAQKESKTRGKMPIVLPNNQTLRTRMVSLNAQDVLMEWGEWAGIVSEQVSQKAGKQIAPLAASRANAPRASQAGTTRQT